MRELWATALGKNTQQRLAPWDNALPAQKIPAQWGVFAYKKYGTMQVIDHIVDRHAATSTYENVSRFAEARNDQQLKRQIMSLADSALRYGTVSPDGRSLVWDSGRVIGTDRSGDAATAIQVFVNNDGLITTAYPVQAP